MNQRETFAMNELPKGIHKITRLPDEALGQLWNSIVVDEEMRSKLLSQAVLNFTLRTKVPRSVIPLHGVTDGPSRYGQNLAGQGPSTSCREVFRKRRLPPS